jgi:hypothetical protein
MKRKFYSILFIFVSSFFISSAHVTAGEYFLLREGFISEFKTVSQRDNEKRESLMEFKVGPKTSLNGIEVMTLTNTIKRANGDIVRGKTFYLENDQGLKIIAHQPPGENIPKMRDYDDWTFKYPLTVGKSWIDNQEVHLKETCIVPIESVIETMDEIVTVPGGTFDRCLRIKRFFSGEVNLGSYGGHPNLIYESYSWYAPNVGLIKGILKIKCSAPNMGAGGIEMEMVSHKN